MASAGAEGSEGLALSEMAVDTELLDAIFLNEVHVYGQVLEIAVQRACKIEKREMMVMSARHLKGKRRATIEFCPQIQP